MSPTDTTIRPTLKTIAEQTGLAITTVSRALKNDAGIARETRAYVRRIADEIGYVPNRAGVRLRTGRTQVLSLVLSPHVEVSSFAHSMIMGLTRALEHSGYNLNVVPDFSSDDGFDLIRQIVVNQAADGVILSRTTPQDRRVRWLLEKGFPFVTHGRTELATAHASHDFDNDAFAHTAAERLIAKGRRRLTLIAPPAHLTFRTHMQTGFERAVARAGAEIVAMDELTLDTPASDVRERICAAGKSGQNADGFVCGGDGCGLAVIAGLHDAGVLLGTDADVVMKQTSQSLDNLVPAIDTIFEDLEHAGHALGSQLMRLVKGEPAAELQSIANPETRFRT